MTCAYLDRVPVREPQAATETRGQMGKRPMALANLEKMHPMEVLSLNEFLGVRTVPPLFPATFPSLILIEEPGAITRLPHHLEFCPYPLPE